MLPLGAFLNLLVAMALFLTGCFISGQIIHGIHVTVVMLLINRRLPLRSLASPLKLFHVIPSIIIRPFQLVIKLRFTSVGVYLGAEIVLSTSWAACGHCVRDKGGRGEG